MKEMKEILVRLRRENAGAPDFELEGRDAALSDMIKTFTPLIAPGAAAGTLSRATVTFT